MIPDYANECLTPEQRNPSMCSFGGVRRAVPRIYMCGECMTELPSADAVCKCQERKEQEHDATTDA